MSKIKAGIIGGAGYTSGEMLRILLHHPAVTIHLVHSRHHAGKLISEVHRDLMGDTLLRFTDTMSNDVDVVFLCAGGKLKVLQP